MLLWEACHRDPDPAAVRRALDGGADVAWAVRAASDQRIAALLWRALGTADSLDALGPDRDTLGATADAFKTSPNLRVVDLDTGAPLPAPLPRLYARATLDPGTGSIIELAVTKRKLAVDAAYQQAYAQAHAFVVATSPTVRAPELEGGKRLTGRPVAVTFYVQVPPTTPLEDSVYITTDASGWVANAMKMDRIDALHYRLTRTYASGTKFAYRYTRGAWTSVEVGEDGLQDDPHQFFVPEVDAKRLTDLVYRWSDQNPTQPQVGPNSIPTPFNPNPFGNLPSGIQHPGIPPASPTPRP